MGRRGFQPTSPVSAAHELVTWIETERRWPEIRECVPANGLHYASFYYKIFQSSCFSHAIRKAFDMMHTSVSSLATTDLLVKRERPFEKKCLGECGRMIRNEGPHIRFCRNCRIAMSRRHDNDNDETYAEPYIQRSTLQRLGIRIGGWEDMIDWSMMDHQSKERKSHGN